MNGRTKMDRHARALVREFEVAEKVLVLRSQPKVDTHIQCRVSSEEKRAFMEVCSARDLSPTDVLRECIRVVIERGTMGSL